MKIRVVTSVIRKDNLFDIEYSIKLFKSRLKGVNVLWELIDCVGENQEFLYKNFPEYGKYEWIDKSFGYDSKNYYLDIFAPYFGKDDWIYFLDDDNIIHPALANWIAESEDVLSGDKYDMVCFGQIAGNGKSWVVAGYDNIKPGKIDTGSVLIRPQAIPSNLRFPLVYVGDGMFYESFANHIGKERILIVNSPITFYNYLR